MATIRSVLWESVVITAFFICLGVKLTYSEDVSYTLYDSETELDSVISFNSHHTLHKRQSGNESTTPSPSQTTTPDYTERQVSQNHKYYTSRVLLGTPEFNNYWDELYDVKHSAPLSGSHRVAVSVPISYKFKFYGHDVFKITIATGGFLYMSPFLHQWLTATQYIAPLMANFDTGLKNESYVLYKEFGDKFVVEWRDVFLQDQNHSDPFSFQTTLHTNGTIVFAYKQVPLSIMNIEIKNHPVKVGVSDAFYIDTVQGGVQRRTIYEYHRVEVDVGKIQSNTVVILDPLTTCNIAKDCTTCLTQEDSFDCKWCPKVKRCSDGIDWLRQEWRDMGCEIQANRNLCKEPQKGVSAATVGGVVVAVLLLTLLIIGGVWFFYAYTHPTSASGQWLINHRPSEMKAKVNKMKFWKRDSGTGEKYRVESTA